MKNDLLNEKACTDLSIEFRGMQGTIGVLLLAVSDGNDKMLDGT